MVCADWMVKVVIISLGMGVIAREVDCGVVESAD